jgi:hypothetical protein
MLVCLCPLPSDPPDGAKGLIKKLTKRFIRKIILPLCRSSERERNHRAITANVLSHKTKAPPKPSFFPLFAGAIFFAYSPKVLGGA